MSNLHSHQCSETYEPDLRQPIAICGMALRVPGARNLEEFWSRLQQKEDCLTRLPRAELETRAHKPEPLYDPTWVHAKPLLDELEFFDAGFFGITENMAKQMSPSHRFFLECCWEAMEMAGMVPGDNKRATGVFVGGEFDDVSYLVNQLNWQDRNPVSELTRQLGNAPDYLSLRVSYELDLKGPSFTSTATCATSLLAIHQAVQNLRLGSCDAALAGGARFEFRITPYYQTGIEGMRSLSGRVRPFDAAADGTVFGNGIGVVVLKRLNDAIRDRNPIHGLVLGTGMSNDGNPEDKQSFIAPTVSGQKQAIRQALADADVNPESIGYVECHGTATIVGDPIELRSLTEIYREQTSKTGFCALGSVKGHVGHLGSAAGVVGLIKTCLILNRGVLPTLANFQTPNPKLPLEQTPFFLCDQNRPWQSHGKARRAAVSSFGFGGANSHVILQQYVPDPGQNDDREWGDRTLHLLPFSAKASTALSRRMQDLARHIESHPESSLADIAHTLQCGRKNMAYRQCVLADISSDQTVAAQIRAKILPDQPTTASRPIVFLFPGQGSQVPGMGQALYMEQPLFRETVDYCAGILEQELGIDIRQKIYPAPGICEEAARTDLAQTFIAQPALFVIEYGLAKLYESWGLRPTAMLGHSLGELVAACLAGAYTLETGLRLVALRGRLMQKSDPGSMLAVFLPLPELKALMPGDLDLAAVNSPSSNVVSGPNDAIDRFAAQLTERKIGHRRLATSHAYHSRMLDTTREEFRDSLRDFELHAPRGVSISNISAAPITEAQATDPDYWVDQRQQPVRFSQSLDNFMLEQAPIFVEMGPGRVLSRFVRQHDTDFETITTLDTQSDKCDEKALLSILGDIWTLGGEVDWSDMYGGEDVHLAVLPTYPFQRRYHWYDLHKAGGEVIYNHPAILYEPGWSLDDIDNTGVPGNTSRWLVFSNQSPLVLQLVDRLAESGHDITVVTPGEGFEKLAGDHYRVSPGRHDSMELLLNDLKPDAGQPLRVLHFWNLDYKVPPSATEIDALGLANEHGFHTLLSLIQHCHNKNLATWLRIQVYADGLAQVDMGEDVLVPVNATLLGPSLVAPQEIPGLSLRCIDLQSGCSDVADSNLLRRVFDECRYDSGVALTALRDTARYKEELFELSEIPRSNAALRHAGTVLITGGVGGLGLRVAEHLFNRHQARLVLTSRWQAPPREQWPEYSTHNDKIGHAIRVISALEDRGAEILVIKADVASPEDMYRVRQQAVAAFGAVHGVVHAAGILDDGPILKKTRASADAVFKAKVVSALVLESLFCDQELDLFIHFSSQASMRPNKGQVDYASANAVLDRLARRRAQDQPGLSSAIGWGAWRDAGMAWSYQGTGISMASLFDKKRGAVLHETLHEVSHPLLQGYQRYLSDDILFQGSLSVGQHWVTTEHLTTQDNSRGILSATTLYELVHACFRIIHPDSPSAELRNTVLIEPLVVGEKTDYQVIFIVVENAYQVELRSRTSQDAGGWIIHFRAEVLATTSKPQLSACPREMLDAVRDRSLGDTNQRAVEEWEGSVNLALAGERWHCIWSAVKTDDAIALRVRLPDPYVEEVQDFYLHPAIFDRSIHHALDQLAGVRVPFTCDSIRILKPLPAETLVYACKSESGSDEGCDLLIHDMDGDLCVELHNYVLRTVSANRASGWDSFRSDSVAVRDRSMVLGKLGKLESFQSRDTFAVPLKADEVRIRVAAAGLNFRDVLTALGQMPNSEVERLRLGAECSGTVIETGENVTDFKPGDRVVAFTDNCFATTALADRQSVSFLPESLTFAEGASIPVTFLTVEYALNHLARLNQGERILIHSATGGVGLAAIQVARRAGAEIYATAGSEIKRDYLRDMGIEHVFDSRSLDFANEIRQAAGAEGLDVVLNSLAGEFATASLELLKPFGRFLELGKRDMYEHAAMDLYPFHNNLSYFGVDLGQFSQHRNSLLRDMFERLMLDFATGQYHPCPLTTFPIEEIGKGFQFMARAQHIGKIVILTEHAGNLQDGNLNRFRSRFGKGIGLAEGLAVFDHLISSDSMLPSVMACAEPLSEGPVAERYQATGAARRSVETEYREPANETEMQLKEIWEKTLGTSPIGMDDDFIDIGGDSISAILLQTSIDEAFGVSLPLASLFRHTTIAEIAVRIHEGVN